MATFTALSPHVTPSLRDDFPLEGLTGRLASEDANENAELLVASIMRDASLCSTSRTSIVLLSRPHHNAAAPSA